MKTKITLSSLIIGATIFNGCANKTVSNDFIKDKSHSIKEVFSKMLYQNDNYPFIYQKYLTFRGDNYYTEINKFNRQMQLLCKTKNGKVTELSEFEGKYEFNQEDMQDRCFNRFSNFEICVKKGNNNIPKVLFIWEAGNKETHRYYANYVHSNIGYDALGHRRKFAYIDGVPDKIIRRNFNEVEEKVCIPDQEDWDFYFKSAQKAYQAKKEEEKIKKEKELKKQKEKELKNSFRRF